MATLPAIAAADPTLDALRAEVERRAALEQPRGYLGMSSIGRSCERQLWYSFRFAVREQFNCDTLWRFDDGFRSEDVMADRLRMVPGVQLRTVDPRTGQQFAFSDFAGHFSGHADGMITGILQAPKTEHIWEAKAVNETKLAKLDKLKAEVGEKQALEQWDSVYHSQAVLYMAYSETKRHYLTASSPGVRKMISVRTDTDLDAARKLRDKAGRIIQAETPLPKISDNPSWYECKWCPAHAICHGGKLPAVDCRTCVHATPELDGNARWSCALRQRDLSTAEQLAGCPSHRYIPALITFAETIDADPDANWVEYRMPDGRTFKNGDAGASSYTSEELRVMDPGMIGDKGADAIRDAFDARHVAPEPLAPPKLWSKAS